MPPPTLDDVRRLAEWQPRLGVVSLYLRFDPGDRGGAWRTELRNGLAALREASDGMEHERRTALRATAERIAERLTNHERSLPRGEVGFVEVGANEGVERWWPTHVSSGTASAVRLGERPVVAPLLCLVERETPRGVALVSAEHVNLIEWRPGSTEVLRRWELSIFVRDWRERRAQRVPDPARAQAVSSSGREHFGDRLADNRQRFLGECRDLALELAAERDWRELLAFGPSPHLEHFCEGAESGSPLVRCDDVDLISAPVGELEAQLERALERREDERGERLAESALERGQGGARGTAGPQETLVALEEARVERLVLDAAHLDDAAAPAAQNGDGPAAGAPIDAELLVRRALASGAAVSALRGEAARMLAPVDGVAALLRY